MAIGYGTNIVEHSMENGDEKKKQTNEEKKIKMSIENRVVDENRNYFTVIDMDQGAERYSDKYILVAFMEILCLMCFVLCVCWAVFRLSSN